MKPKTHGKMSPPHGMLLTFSFLCCKLKLSKCNWKKGDISWAKMADMEGWGETYCFFLAPPLRPLENHWAQSSQTAPTLKSWQILGIVERCKKKRMESATTMPILIMGERDKEPCSSCCSVDASGAGATAAAAVEAGGGLLSDKQCCAQGKVRPMASHSMIVKSDGWHNPKALRWTASKFHGGAHAAIQQVVKK